MSAPSESARPVFGKAKAFSPPPPSARRSAGNVSVAWGAVGAIVFAGAAAWLAVAPRAAAPVAQLSLARIDPVARDSAPLSTDASASTAPADGAEVVLTTTPDTGQGLADQSASAGEAVITLPDSDADTPAPTTNAQGLAQAPLVGLSEPSPSGPLPVIASDGRTAASAYARTFVSNGKPEVALIIGGLGLNAQATREAISDLPPQVTLSFAPYADGLQGWIDLARAAGHEVLIETPMEPSDYPKNDPGPYTLLANGNAADITRKLDWIMSRATGYFGLTNYLGEKFVASPPAMDAFAAELKRRGLAFIDDGAAANFGGSLPRASANRIVDEQLSASAIDGQFQALERRAADKGAALGSGFAYPVTLAEATRWTRGLAARGFQLAPASALMVRR
ncbi:MAG TPA: divergent polysaccharide deacetylase family protein [Caulobacteraceae bacterium]|nr:divergent polysaccharide deacetylase family protein [Caulobacteraceae bacterium]